MFRTFPDSLYHDTEFSNHQYGKHNQEDEEGSLYRTGFQTGNSRIHRKHILNGPRLTTDFGYNPSGLTGNVSQRNTPQGNMMQPRETGQLLLVSQEKHHGKEEDEITA